MPDNLDETIFNDLDKEKSAADIAKTAEEIAAKKFSELQDNLVTAIGGQKKKGYNNFDEMTEDVEARAKRIAEEAARAAEERVTKKFEDEKKAEIKAREEQASKLEEKQQQEWAQMSAEWRDAVGDGVAPAVSDEVAEKLKKGVKYEDLSETERKDPGLVFYNRAREFHAQLKKEGKASSFYRSIMQYKTQKPAGAHAPVFGGGIPPSSQDEEVSYDEIAEKRKAIFKF